jgi:transposase
MIATTRPELSVNGPVLYVALELAKKEWKLAMTSGLGVAPVLRTVRHGDWVAWDRALGAGLQRCGLPPAAVVVSCYEAGRDAFWIHRALVARGIHNRVVDSSSIEVNRRARRTKTDRIDAIKLVQMLVRVCYGEARVWSEVRVPRAADEARRHVSRERTALIQEQTRLINQMRGWLTTCGTTLPRHRREGWWATVRDWAGAVLPPAVQARLRRAQARLRLVVDQIAELDAHQRERVAGAAVGTPLARLVALKGIATTGASVLIDEGLVWRAFQNRRQLGALLGFAPAKYQSGESSHDQGISRAGNDRLQATMTQLAWSWVHWQPRSALTLWYRARFGQGHRARKIGIVALARKLFIALWRWATHGVPPAGAVLSPA